MGGQGGTDLQKSCQTVQDFPNPGHKPHFPAIRGDSLWRTALRTYIHLAMFLDRRSRTWAQYRFSFFPKWPWPPVHQSLFPMILKRIPRFLIGFRPIADRQGPSNWGKRQWKPRMRLGPR